MSGQNVNIRKINEPKNLTAGAVKGLSADGAYIVIEVPNKGGAGYNPRKLYNDNYQLKIKLVDIFNTLPVLAAAAAATGQVYVDSTSGVVTIKP